MLSLYDHSLFSLQCQVSYLFRLVCFVAFDRVCTGLKNSFKMTSDLESRWIQPTLEKSLIFAISIANSFENDDNGNLKILLTRYMWNLHIDEMHVC